jgi:hypothetical protein
MSSNKIFVITENGFSMTDNKVSVPACRISASSYTEAASKLTVFLETGKLTDDIELITPYENIDFNS